MPCNDNIYYYEGMFQFDLHIYYFLSTFPDFVSQHPPLFSGNSFDPWQLLTISLQLLQSSRTYTL